MRGLHCLDWSVRSYEISAVKMARWIKQCPIGAHTLICTVPYRDSLSLLFNNESISKKEKRRGSIYRQPRHPAPEDAAAVPACVCTTLGIPRQRMRPPCLRLIRRDAIPRHPAPWDEQSPIVHRSLIVAVFLDFKLSANLSVAIQRSSSWKRTTALLPFKPGINTSSICVTHVDEP
jgi:hypothetical protein